MRAQTKPLPKAAPKTPQQALKKAGAGPQTKKPLPKAQTKPLPKAQTKSLPKAQTKSLPKSNVPNPQAAKKQPPQQQGWLSRMGSQAASGIGNFTGAVVSAAGNGVAGAGRGAGTR
ncbi:hypothetical protein SLS60_005149 [Paraconiothyrium brasiliense]|uniref:Uncharacterized protein n=1 Tax=Paraconiothyrium brasiliense TaxID=300254 RepID=A0ABR3RGJ6_9PLEO